MGEGGGEVNEFWWILAFFVGIIFLLVLSEISEEVFEHPFLPRLILFGIFVFIAVKTFLALKKSIEG
jgi:hypothetical protein